MSFSNKVVIVTGASSGIGAATAVLFAKEGANVVMVARNETKLKNVSEHCEKNGKKPLVVKADISFDDEAKRVIKETVDKYGKIDILVNNAGIVRVGCLADGNVLKAYDEVMSTNLRAVVHLTSLATPYLKETRGNIVNVSGIGGKIVHQTPVLMAYCASKAGLDHFSRCAALELASAGVRVNVVSPGPVLTDVAQNTDFPVPSEEEIKLESPLDRVMQPEEIADLIIFLASDKAKGITGSNFLADNGTCLKSC